MGLSIYRTPNGRFYVWNDAVEQGYRCSPYFRSLNNMIARWEEIDSRRKLIPHRLKNFVRLEYSRGWMPGRGPELKPEDIPDWLAQVDPGKDGSKIPIMERDRVLFFVEELDDYIEGTAVKRDRNKDWVFTVRTTDTRYLMREFTEVERDLIKLK